MPSYEDFPDYDVVLDFLDMYKSKCVGVIGTGNMNFGELYLCTAKEICKEYNLPLLYGVEFSGTDRDVEQIKEIISKKESV